MSSTNEVVADSLEHLLGLIDFNIDWYGRHAKKSKGFHYLSQSALILVPLFASVAVHIPLVPEDVSSFAMLLSSAIAGIVALFSPYRRWKQFKVAELSLHFLKFELIARMSALRKSDTDQPDLEIDLLLQYSKRFEKILFDTADQFFSDQNGSKQDIT